MANGPDFIISLRRDTAVVAAQSAAAQRWVNVVLLPDTDGRVTITRENVDELEKRLSDEGFHVTVR